MHAEFQRDPGDCLRRRELEAVGDGLEAARDFDRRRGRRNPRPKRVAGQIDDELEAELLRNVMVAEVEACGELARVALERPKNLRDGNGTVDGGRQNVEPVRRGVGLERRRRTLGGRDPRGFDAIVHESIDAPDQLRNAAQRALRHEEPYGPRRIDHVQEIAELRAIVGDVSRAPEPPLFGLFHLALTRVPAIRGRAGSPAGLRVSGCRTLGVFADQSVAEAFASSGRSARTGAIEPLFAGDDVRVGDRLLAFGARIGGERRGDHFAGEKAPVRIAAVAGATEVLGRTPEIGTLEIQRRSLAQQVAGVETASLAGDAFRARRFASAHVAGKAALLESSYGLATGDRESESRSQEREPSRAMHFLAIVIGSANTDKIWGNLPSDAGLRAIET